MGKEKLLPEDCLEDRHFQDWLVVAQIMRRRSLPRNGLELKPTKINQPTLMLENFLGILVQSQGYLLSRIQLAQGLYGKDDEAALQTVSVWMSYIKSRLLRPKYLYHAFHVGWGVGISDFRLHREGIPLMYRLWEDMAHDVPTEDLAKTLYGVVDQHTYRDTTIHMRQLRQKFLQNTKVEVEYQKVGQKYQSYRVRYREDE